MIPLPIAAYVLAENSHDTDAVVRCFTQSAQVKDEGKIHHGLEAIKKWKVSTTSLYSSQIAPIQVTSSDNGYVLKASVSGDFPGSPVTLHFYFRVSDSLISYLEVTV